MRGPANETVGPEFSADLLKAARDHSLELLLKVANEIRPGCTEEWVKERLQVLQQEMGSPRNWHLPQIRFGENTLLPFGKKGIENAVLKETDIYFLDIGPIFNGHEGDVGRPFFVGNDPDMRRCCEDAEKIWLECRAYWREMQPTGAALYNFAKTRASELGWNLLVNQANGHRIADFPHAARIRGSIEEFLHSPAPNRWILEIQIRHPEKLFGAFYEDLLN